jgi:hypothetical protein
MIGNAVSGGRVEQNGQREACERRHVEHSTWQQEKGTGLCSLASKEQPQTEHFSHSR